MIPYSDKPRTAALAAGLLVCLLLAGLGESALNTVTQPLAERRAKILKLNQAIDRQQLQIASLKQSTVKIDRWRQRSLPADVSRATTLYQHWLLDQLRQLGLEHAIVTPSNPIVRTDHQLIPVQVETEATLENCVALLGRIENAPLEQRVKRFQIQPASRDGGDMLRVVIQLEALSFTGALKSTQRQEIALFDDSSRPVAAVAPAVTLALNPFVPHRQQVPVTIEATPQPLTETTVNAETVATTVPQPVMRLIATIDHAGKKEAWLFDAQSKEHVVVYEKKPVNLPMGTISVARITSQSIDVVHGTQRHTIQLGESIALPSQTAASPLSFILGALQIK